MAPEIRAPRPADLPRPARWWEILGGSLAFAIGTFALLWAGQVIAWALGCEP